jgi:hypothetical protein
MKNINVVIFLFFILITNCITTFEKDRFTEKISYNSLRMEPVLVIIHAQKENTKYNYDNAKIPIIKQFNDCRCFTSFTVISGEDNIDLYKNKYKYKIEIYPVVVWDFDEILINIILSSFSLFLIPNWNTVQYEFTYSVKDIDEKELGNFKYQNTITVYKHLFLVFAMPFREAQLNLNDISNKALYEIYSQKLIPLAN